MILCWCLLNIRARARKCTASISAMSKPPSLQKYSIAKPEIEMEELKYYNEYGGFIRDGKEYIIRINKNNTTPVVWSHVMANEDFGSVVTGNGG